jgi:vacuolar-type H+-ATPase subunit E/Vma4
MTVMSNATKTRDSILAELDVETDKILEEKRKKFNSEAEKYLNKGMEDVIKEGNDLVSKSIVDGKKDLMKKRKSIIDSVFADLEDKLLNFTKAPEYKQYFSKRFSEALNTVLSGIDTKNGLNVEVYLTPYDKSTESDYCIKAINNAVPGANIKIIEDTSDIIGGCKINLAGRNKMVDNTMRTFVEYEKEHFLEWNRLSID